MGEVFFQLIGTNCIHVEAQNERFSVVGRVVVRTSNLKISRRRLAEKYSRKCAACAVLFFLSFDQSYH